MSFSYNAVWEDTLGLLRRHGPLLTAIAGVFLFMPALLLAVFVPPPEPQSGASPERVMQMTLEYYHIVWPWLLIQVLFAMVGTLAMLRLVFGRDTVGGALVQGLLLLPFYFLLWVITGFMFMFGIILLVIPAFYLFGRLAPLQAVLVAENRRNPLDAIGRAFALTRGRGWAVFGLVFVVGIVAFIAISVAQTLFGLIFVLAAGQVLGKLLTAVVASALDTALASLLTMLNAAIYRALAGTGSVAAAFE